VLSPEPVFGPTFLLVGDLFCEFLCGGGKGKGRTYNSYEKKKKKEKRKDYDDCAFNAK
jgi:hypothetical protein